MTADTLTVGIAGPDDFDFWLGEWDADVGNGKSGTNTLRRVLGDAVIEEDFRSADLNGRSWSVFIPLRKVWVQTWVDDKSSYLLFTGGREPDGRRILSQRLPLGGAGPHRMVFDKITPQAFEWEWQRSDDRGDTWKLLWHIDYRRRGPA